MYWEVKFNFVLLIRNLAIDNVIWKYTNGGKYMTKFNPSLQVVEYSEADHHNRVERMEMGC